MCYYCPLFSFISLAVWAGEEGGIRKVSCHYSIRKFNLPVILALVNGASQPCISPFASSSQLCFQIAFPLTSHRVHIYLNVPWAGKPWQTGKSRLRSLFCPAIRHGLAVRGGFCSLISMAWASLLLGLLDYEHCAHAHNVRDESHLRVFMRN